MTDAHRLYERLGFVRTPRAGLVAGPTSSLIAFRLDLEESLR